MNILIIRYMWVWRTDLIRVLVAAYSMKTKQRIQNPDYAICVWILSAQGVLTKNGVSVVRRVHQMISGIGEKVRLAERLLSLAGFVVTIQRTEEFTRIRLLRCPWCGQRPTKTNMISLTHDCGIGEIWEVHSEESWVWWVFAETLHKRSLALPLPSEGKLGFEPYADPCALGYE